MPSYSTSLRSRSGVMSASTTLMLTWSRSAYSVTGARPATAARRRSRSSINGSGSPRPSARRGVRMSGRSSSEAASMRLLHRPRSPGSEEILTLGAVRPLPASGSGHGDDAVDDVDGHGVAVGHLALEDRDRQLVADLPLDEPLEGPGAEHRVETERGERRPG